MARARGFHGTIAPIVVPAAAYAGVSVAIGASQQALDGLAMLLVNIIMLLSVGR